MVDVGFCPKQQAGRQSQSQNSAFTLAAGTSMPRSSCIMNRSVSVHHHSGQPINADLVHDVGICCTGDLNTDLAGPFCRRPRRFQCPAMISSCVSPLTAVSADRSVSTDAGAAHGAGDGQRAAGERFRQQGGTGFRVTGFFPTHVVCPPILIVMVSCVCASLPAA